MTRIRSVRAPNPPAPPLAPLAARLRTGAVEGGAFGLYLLLLECVIDRLRGATALSAWPGVVPRGLALVVGVAVGGSLLRALKPRVRSVWSSMFLGMLCLVPVLAGAGILMAGWRPAAVFLLVLTVPLGIAFGFIDWNHLYRNAPPRDRLPPA